MRSKTIKIIVIAMMLIVVVTTVAYVGIVIIDIVSTTSNSNLSDEENIKTGTNTKKPTRINGNVGTGEISTSMVQTGQELAPSFRCIISSAPNFKTASSEGTLSIANNKDNEGYLLQVTIKDNTTGNTMYVSPLLKANEKVDTGFLSDKSYVKGEYPATAYFDFYTEDEVYFYTVPISITMSILG